MGKTIVFHNEKHIKIAQEAVNLIQERVEEQYKPEEVIINMAMVANLTAVFVNDYAKNHGTTVEGVELRDVENSLLGKTIDTGITGSKDEIITIRSSLIDNFLGKWDEIGIETRDEKEKNTNAVWVYRRDLPKLIAVLQKFV